jgi:hypothetical protein
VIQYDQTGAVYTTNLIYKIEADIWIGSEALSYGG